MRYKVKLSNFTFGVPASLFAYKYNLEQFEIIGLAHGDLGKALGLSVNIDKNQWLQLKSKNKSIRRGDLMLLRGSHITVPCSRILIKLR